MNEKEKYARFSTLPWMEKKTDSISVDIGGAGTIGSWLAIWLARQNIDVSIYDFDRVEAVNLAGQAFGETQIGELKTEAISEVVSFFTGKIITNYEMHIDNDFNAALVCFSCFDNMAARKALFERWKETCIESKANEPDEDSFCLFVDGRMTAEVGMCYFVTPKTAHIYEKELCTEAEVIPAICSQKATTHNGAILAGLMTSGFDNYLANYLTKQPIRDECFKIEYELPIMNFTIKTAEEVWKSQQPPK